MLNYLNKGLLTQEELERLLRNQQMGFDIINRLFNEEETQEMIEEGVQNPDDPSDERIGEE